MSKKTVFNETGLTYIKEINEEYYNTNSLCQSTARYSRQTLENNINDDKSSKRGDFFRATSPEKLVKMQVKIDKKGKEERMYMRKSADQIKEKDARE